LVYNINKGVTMLLLLLTSLTSAESHIKWKNIPVITICANESKTNVSVIKNAKKYWESKGYTIGNIIKKDCDNEIYPYGEIRFVGERTLDINSYFGMTNRGYADGNIVSGHIQLSNQDANNVELVTHELGHALGIQHNDNKNDLMYEYHMYENTPGF